VCEPGPKLFGLGGIVISTIVERLAVALFDDPAVLHASSAGFLRRSVRLGGTGST
jgi:hypothetical protein